MYNKQQMTLIELLIVITILSITATLVLESGVDQLAGQARFNNTTARAKSVEKVICGHRGRIGRFVEDMGRLPEFITGQPLSELWSPTTTPAWNSYTLSLSPNDLKSYAHNSPTGTNILSFNFERIAGIEKNGTNFDLTLDYGWRGPYLAISGTDFKDGFGNNWIPLQKDFTDATTNTGDETVDGQSDDIYGLRTKEVSAMGAYGKARQFRFNQALITKTHIQIKLKSITGKNLIPWNQANTWASIMGKGEAKRTFNYIRLFLISASRTNEPHLDSAIADFHNSTWTLTPSDNSLVTCHDFDHSEFKALLPGRYKIIAYAYAIKDNETTTKVAFASTLEEIEVKPGFNHFELQLRHDIK